MRDWLALAFFMLFLLVLLIQGIAWLVTNELFLVVAFLAAGGIWLFVYYQYKQSVKNQQISSMTSQVAIVKSAAARASQAVATLTNDRAAIERKSQELEDLRTRLRGDGNFQILKQQHHESRLLADSWYAHMSQGVTSKKELTSGIGSFRNCVREIARTRRSSNGHHRSRLSREIETAQITIDGLSSAIGDLQGEIDRSRAALDKYNNQTGNLRDHIRNTCGEQGLQWYNSLQDRKKRRSIDE